MKKIIYIIMPFLLLSCQKSANKAQESIVSSKKYLLDYIISHDRKALEKSYNVLKHNDDFVKNGLTDENRDTAIAVLMYLKKYDELINLLNNDKSVDGFKKEITLNLLKALKNKQDESSNSYILKNVALIKEQIHKKPNDSLLYVDYFTMRLYLKGRSTSIHEIDSMKVNNKRFSDDYYDLVLKDLINDYPDEFLR